MVPTKLVVRKWHGMEFKSLIMSKWIAFFINFVQVYSIL